LVSHCFCRCCFFRLHLSRTSLYSTLLYITLLYSTLQYYINILCHLHLLTYFPMCSSSSFAKT
jgi:hypothetical protein